MAKPLKEFEHDPDATLDYTIDWSGWLAPGDVIAASEWSFPDGVLVATVTDFSDTTATAWISSPNARVGRSYPATNRVTTGSVPPRVDDRTIVLLIRDQ